jgi:hypothetical protein
LILARIRVAIAVEDDALAQVEDIVRACSAVGFRSSCELIVVGVVTGSVDPDKLQALRAVPGVAAVEVQHDVRIHSALRLRNSAAGNG